MTNVNMKPAAASSLGTAFSTDYAMGRAFYDLKPEPTDLAETIASAAKAGYLRAKAAVQGLFAPVANFFGQHRAFGIYMAMDESLLHDLGMGRGDVAALVNAS